MLVNFLVRESVPNKSAGREEYIGLVVKNFFSAFKLSSTGILLMTSSWHLFLIPTYPYLRGIY